MMRQTHWSAGTGRRFGFRTVVQVSASRDASRFEMESGDESPHSKWRLRRSLSLLFATVLFFVAGCAGVNPPLPPPGATASGIVPNPYFTPVADHEFVFDQIIDTLDNYFEIEAEERVRIEEGVVLEGRVETLPTIGATYLEPWRDDSVGSFERLQATLQTIRRRASVRMIPSAQGYSIEVIVSKELEDLAQPEATPVTNISPIHNTELDREANEASSDQSPLPAGVLGWIPLGRDAALEQRILGELANRLAL